ncbi:hypothetical protein [Streptomyces fragilis]|uniref:Uncharacterized protein n=1 Tax=Streptomyces fragilis TaxID=67301 RepID=A0ABV2YK35_9ACTN|nr:hypothetical protein [Streptomyces fragilis]
MRVGVGMLLVLMGLFSALGGARKWAEVFGGETGERVRSSNAVAYRLVGWLLVVGGILCAAGVGE